MYNVSQHSLLLLLVSANGTGYPPHLPSQASGFLIEPGSLVQFRQLAGRSRMNPIYMTHAGEEENKSHRPFELFSQLINEKIWLCWVYPSHLNGLWSRKLQLKKHRERKDHMMCVGFGAATIFGE